MRWSSTNILEAKMLSFDYVDNLYEDVAGLAKDTLFCPHWNEALRWFKIIQSTRYAIHPFTTSCSIFPAYA